MDLVRDPDRLGGADLANAESPDGRELVAREDRADQARQVVLVSDRREHPVDSRVGLDHRPAIGRVFLVGSLRLGLAKRRPGPKRQPFGRHGSEDVTTVDHARIGSGSSRLGGAGPLAPAERSGEPMFSWCQVLIENSSLFPGGTALQRSPRRGRARFCLPSTLASCRSSHCLRSSPPP